MNRRHWSGKTRRARALELLDRIRTGPAFVADGGRDFPHAEPMTREQMRNAWAIWAESWITPELIDLIKELEGQSIDVPRYKRARSEAIAREVPVYGRGPAPIENAPTVRVEPSIKG